MSENGDIIETPHTEKDTAERHSAGMFGRSVYNLSTRFLVGDNR
jgi:hypothetical protein